VVVATNPQGSGDAAVSADALSACVRLVRRCGLPLMVAYEAGLEPVVEPLTAAQEGVGLQRQPDLSLAQRAGRAVAAGVMGHPHASGWVVLPAAMGALKPETVLAVAQALHDNPAAYAQHSGRRGQPVGFAAELFSELVALSHFEGLRRLLARYPALGLELDDPAVLQAPAALGLWTEAAAPGWSGAMTSP
jgi:molybdenum cofactor cytidylyltransferase